MGLKHRDLDNYYLTRLHDDVVNVSGWVGRGEKD